VPIVRADLSDRDSGEPLIKRNYRQVKRQKEEARKTRQLQKQQRRADRSSTTGATLGIEAEQDRESVDQPLPPESQESR